MAVIKQLRKYGSQWEDPVDFGADAVNIDLNISGLNYIPENNNLQSQIITLDFSLKTIDNNVTRIIGEASSATTLETLQSSIESINTNIANIRQAGGNGIILHPTTDITGKVTDNTLTVFAQKYNGLYTFVHNANNYIKIVELNTNTLTVVNANANTVASGGGSYNGYYRMKITPGSGWMPLIALYPQFTNGSGGVNCSNMVCWRHWLQQDSGTWYYYASLRNYAASQAKVKVFAKVVCIKTS